MENKLVYVIGSQGGVYFGKYQLQSWVENINKVLISNCFKVTTFTAGYHRDSYIKNDVKVFISRRIPFFLDPFSLDIPLKLLFYERPLFVIIHGLQHFLTLLSLLVLSIRNIPVVLIVHGLYKETKNNIVSFLRDSILKQFLRFTKLPYLLIALTNYDKLLLLKEWRIPINKIIISKVFLYINSEELRMIEKIKRSDIECRKNVDKVRFLYVGRLDYHQKRIDRLIKIFYQYLMNLKLQNCCGVELIIIGEGPMRPFISRMVKKLKIENNIKVIGSVSEKEKWRLYLTGIALVLTSEFEGLPRTFYEAFAAGNIVIAPNICGLGEVIYNGVNGYLFNNESELFEILTFILGNKEKVAEMGYKNYEQTKKELILENNEIELIKIFDKLLSR